MIKITISSLPTFYYGCKTVKATVTVMPEKTVEVKPTFVNKPDGLEITEDMISIEPSTILLAGPAEVLDKTSYVNLGGYRLLNS